MLTLSAAPHENNPSRGKRCRSHSTDWQKTSCKPDPLCSIWHLHYARLRVKGKLIRKSLKTNVLSVGHIFMPE
jgi:hypothetical protein